MPLSEALSRGSGDASGAAAAMAYRGGGDDEMNNGDNEMNGDGGDDGDGVPSSSSSPAATAAEARRLAQCADVFDWCFAEGSAAADSLRGRHGSEAEWRVAVSRRRAAVSGGVVGGGSVRISSTFLDALRARAAAGSSSSATLVEYPPAPTPRAAAPAIFLSGGASPSALSAKLDLFAYCLADAGEEELFFEFFCYFRETDKKIETSHSPFFHPFFPKTKTPQHRRRRLAPFPGRPLRLLERRRRPVEAGAAA